MSIALSGSPDLMHSLREEGSKAGFQNIVFYLKVTLATKFKKRYFSFARLLDRPRGINITHYLHNITSYVRCLSCTMTDRLADVLIIVDWIAN
jgi:hypothetical protein